MKNFDPVPGDLIRFKTTFVHPASQIMMVSCRVDNTLHGFNGMGESETRHIDDCDPATVDDWQVWEREHTVRKVALMNKRDELERQRRNLEAQVAMIQKIERK